METQELISAWMSRRIQFTLMSTQDVAALCSALGVGMHSWKENQGLRRRATKPQRDIKVVRTGEEESVFLSLPSVFAPFYLGLWKGRKGFSFSVPRASSSSSLHTSSCLMPTAACSPLCYCQKQCKLKAACISVRGLTALQKPSAPSLYLG